jgi:hypothetical protein
VCEGTIPIKYLNDEGKGKPREMKNLYCLILYPPECSEKKKYDPEKMDENNDICKNLVEHFIGSKLPPLLPLPWREREES